MEENEEIVVDKREEQIDKNEEENDKLLNERDKVQDIDKNLNDKTTVDENKEILINTNNDNQNIEITKDEVNKENIINNKNNNNLIIKDYLITIQYTKFFHIPYFIFGNVLNFYCPCHKFNSQPINLSQMPTPPFGIVLTECKKNMFLIFINFI